MLGDSVSILMGFGDGAFGRAVTYAVRPAPYHLALADVDGNGALDLAVTNLRGSDVSILLGQGTR